MRLYDLYFKICGRDAVDVESNRRWIKTLFIFMIGIKDLALL